LTVGRGFPVRAVAWLALGLWSAAAFWTFSLSFSASFFRYNLASRLPPFLAAWLAATALPLLGARAWRRVRVGRTGIARAWIEYVLLASAALVPFLLTTAVERRLPSPWRMSADDAMGAGIDFLILLGLEASMLVAVTGALLVARRGRPDGRR